MSPMSPTQCFAWRPMASSFFIHTKHLIWNKMPVDWNWDIDVQKHRQKCLSGYFFIRETTRYQFTISTNKKRVWKKLGRTFFYEMHVDTNAFYWNVNEILRFIIGRSRKRKLAKKGREPYWKPPVNNLWQERKGSIRFKTTKVFLWNHHL